MVLDRKIRKTKSALNFCPPLYIEREQRSSVAVIRAGSEHNEKQEAMDRSGKRERDGDKPLHPPSQTGVLLNARYKESAQDFTCYTYRLQDKHAF